MKFIDGLKYLRKNSYESKEAKKITDRLPSNDTIAKEILNNIGNTKTKVVLDKDIKNSYYVYLRDTIYISNKEKNNNFHRCCLVAHECVHSIQSKVIQKINFCLSNIELALFVLIAIISFFIKLNAIMYFYFAFCIVSIIPRLYLELDAIRGSIRLSRAYLEKKLKKQECEKMIDIYTTQIRILLPFSFLSLFFGKIIRCLLIFFLMFII